MRVPVGVPARSTIMFAFSVSPFPLTHGLPSLSYTSSRTLALRASRFRGASLQLAPFSHESHTSCRQIQTPKCFSDPPDDDDEDEEEEQAEILLTDPHTNRSLAVGVEHSVTSKGKTYLLCYPVDDPVAFARVSDRDMLEQVEDNALAQKMFPNAEAVLAEEHIALKNSAFFMTIDDQSEDLSEGDDEDEEDDGDDEEADDQDVEVIGEFLYDGVQHFVVRPTDSILLVAEEMGDGYRVLEGKDLEEASPAIEEFIEGLDVAAA